VRPAKPVTQALLANIAPLAGSLRVTVNGAAAARDGPSTHST
jgi:hypothetical protein